MSKGSSGRRRFREADAAGGGRGLRTQMFRAACLLLVLSACGPEPTVRDERAVPAATSSPTTADADADADGSTTPIPDSPNDDPEDVLYRYCLTEEHIIGIETRLLDKPPAQAVRDLREAQAFAYAQSTALADAGRPEQASAVRAWGHAFDQSITRMRRGDDPFDALLPATRALGHVGELIECEVDL